MPNSEIVRFIAIMQRGFDWQIYQFLLLNGLHNKSFLQTKKLKEKFSGLQFCFLFLNWKVLSSKTFRGHKLPKEKFHTDIRKYFFHTASGQCVE